MKLFLKQFYVFSVVTATIFFAMSHTSEAARLYAESAEQTVSMGQPIVIDWFIDTEGESINIINGEFKFTRDTLEITDINPANGAVTLWVNKPSVVAPGTVSFAGGIPGGVIGPSVPIFRTTLRAVKTGTAAIILEDGSNVFLNNGEATKANLAFSPLQFSILPEDTLPIKVKSETHPDQTKWYHNRDVSILFTPKKDELYSYSFSSNKEIIPPDKAMDTNGKQDFINMLDGIYTFKINTKILGGNWQEAGIYRVKIDNTPPEDFVPIISSHPDLFNGNFFVSFSTVDKMSGISHYEVRSGWFGFYHEASTPYKFHRPIVGDRLTVKAIDNAGNIKYETVYAKAFIPVWLFIILLIVIPSAWYVFFYKKRA